MNVPVFFLVLVCGLLCVLILYLLIHGPRRNADSPTGDGDCAEARSWYGGLVYHNPDDPALFVPKRSGLGWTLNVGHPLGKVVVGGLILALVVGALLPVLVGAPLCHGPGCPPSR